MAGLNDQYNPDAVNVDQGRTLEQMQAEVQANSTPPTSQELGEGAIVLGIYAVLAVVAFFLARAVWRYAKFWPSRVWRHLMSMLRDVRDATR